MYSFTSALKIDFLLFQIFSSQTKVTSDNTESIISRALHKLLLQPANAKFTINFLSYVFFEILKRATFQCTSKYQLLWKHVKKALFWNTYLEEALPSTIFSSFSNINPFMDVWSFFNIVHEIVHEQYAEYEKVKLFFGPSTYSSIRTCV